MSGLGQPGSDWRDGESETKKEMSRMRKTFRDRVKKNDNERRDRKRTGHAIDCERAKQESE